jgi:ABC-2 type transport system permease protein
MTNLGLTFTLIQWLFLLLMLACAPMIELGIILSLSSVAFWTSRSAALAEAAFQVNWNMTQQYPLDMFGRGFRVLVTLFIPVAFLNYYPARWLLGKTLPGDPLYFLSFLSPLAAAVTLGIAAFVWQRGVRQYSSPGN